MAQGGSVRAGAARKPLPREARAAAEEAVLLRLLGLLFERPKRGWAEEVRSLIPEQADERLGAIAARAATVTEGEYLAALGPGGFASPREVAYRGFADPGRLLSDLSAIYGAFAFHPRAEDPPDHVAVEIGFAGYLAMKEAFTITAGDEEGAARTREGRALFLEAHLRPFAAGLRRRLENAAPASHLAEAAGFLARWAGCGPADLETGAAPDGCGSSAGEAAMTCGGCAGAGPDPEARPGNDDPFVPEGGS
jgi:hypothetical protein